MDEENKSVTEVTKSQKKEGLMSRLVSSMLRTVDFEKMGNDLMQKIVEPKLKDLVWTMLENIGQSIIFHRPVADDPSRPVAYNGTERYDYNARYRNATSLARTVDTTKETTNRYSSVFSGPIKFLFKTSIEGEEVLSDIRKAKRTYGQIKVADVYDFCGLIPETPMANKYGWTDISEFWLHWDPETDKWVLEVPRPKSL